MSPFSESFVDLIGVKSLTSVDAWGEPSYGTTRNVFCKFRPAAGLRLTLGIEQEVSWVLHTDERIELSDLLVLPDGTEAHPKSVRSSQPWFGPKVWEVMG
jgi:hypothetical protein